MLDHGFRSYYNNMWFVYLLLCGDSTYYCGITKDIKRRIHEHNSTKRGAKYTRSRRPVSLIGFKEVESRSKALRVERKVKNLPRSKKIDFFT